MPPFACSSNSGGQEIGILQRQHAWAALNGNWRIAVELHHYWSCLTVVVRKAFAGICSAVGQP